MRKNITKEITFTIVKSAKMEIHNGLPQAVPCQDITLLGRLSEEKAKRAVKEEYGEMATAYEISTMTKTYILPVTEFLKYATEKPHEFYDADEDEDEEEE